MLAMGDPEGTAMSFGETDVTTLEFICDTAAAALRRGQSFYTHKCGISRLGETLANWRNVGRGPEYVKIEHKVLYPLKAVEEYERANLHRPLAV